MRDYVVMEAFFDRATRPFLAAGAGVPELDRDDRLRWAAGTFPPYYDQPDLDRAPFGRHLGPAYNQEAVDLFRDRPIRAQGGLPPAVGGQGDGLELARQLNAALARAGIDVLLEHRVRSVLVDDGTVTGVHAETPGGMVTVHARRAVVFASGGFSMNKALSDELLAGPIYGTGAAPTCVGDFIGIGRELGAELGHTEEAWWCEIPLEAGLEQRIMDWLLFIAYGDSMIEVNREGRRVVNEKALYNDRGRAHFIGGAEEGYPNRILMLIYDDAVATNGQDWITRWPIPLSDGRKPTLRASDIDEEALVISGNTLEELADNIAERLKSLQDKTDGFTLAPGFVDGLRQSIVTFNSYAERGVDEEFQRGEARVQVAMNGPAREGNGKNPTMYPISRTGPYHCILTGAGTLETKGGPRIDEHGRVLRANGTPIPRLYGAGNCIANPTAQAYWSGGATLGTAMVAGYIAGGAAAGETPGEDGTSVAR